MLKIMLVLPIMISTWTFWHMYSVMIWTVTHVVLNLMKNLNKMIYSKCLLKLLPLHLKTSIIITMTRTKVSVAKRFLLQVVPVLAIGLKTTTTIGSVIHGEHITKKL